MIKRDQIENILKVNGVNPGSPDEQIRSILLSARYSKDEVDTAIMVLRENERTNQTRVDGLHKIFRSDQALRPEEITQLLGIEVDATEYTQAAPTKESSPLLQHLIVWFLSILLAVVGIIVYMYLFEIGPFHPSSTLMVS